MDIDYQYEEMMEDIRATVVVELIGTDLFVTNHDRSISAKMEIGDLAQTEIVENLLGSNDFWASFLGSLSAALGRTS